MYQSIEDFTNSLEEGDVFYFFDENINTNNPHYNVILNNFNEGKNNTTFIIFSIATSQIKKRLNK